jgi:tetratricopeptide (TPR) repeat protein
MKDLKLLVVVVVLSVLFACSDSRETRMQRFLVQGNEKIREQEYEQAERYFFSALDLDSCFADALNNLGTVEERRQNFREAIQYYSKAIACNDTFMLPYLNRASLYYEANEMANAMNDLKVYEKRYPESLVAMELKGLLYWKMKDEEKSGTIFRHLLRKRPGYKNALINLGTLYTSRKNFDSAFFFLQEALRVDSSDARAQNSMAMFYAAMGEITQAEKWINKALAQMPDDAYFMNNKGYILLLTKAYDDAILIIDQSLTTDPYNGWAYRNKGIYYFQRERYEDALRLLEQAEKLDPNIDELSYWMAKTLWQVGKKEQACPYFRNAVTSREVSKEDVPDLCH